MSGFLNVAKLFARPDDMESLTDQVAMLRTMLINTIQDLEVLKNILRERELWEEGLYRQLRTHRMAGDHSGAGSSPWTHYSYFAYTLDEEAFLRHRFNATDEELAAYRKEVETMRQLS